MSQGYRYRNIDFILRCIIETRTLTPNLNMKSPSLDYAPNEHNSQCGMDTPASQFYL